MYRSWLVEIVCILWLGKIIAFLVVRRRLVHLFLIGFHLELNCFLPLHQPIMPNHVVNNRVRIFQSSQGILFLHWHEDFFFLFHHQSCLLDLFITFFDRKIALFFRFTNFLLRHSFLFHPHVSGVHIVVSFSVPISLWRKGHMILGHVRDTMLSPLIDFFDS